MSRNNDPTAVIRACYDPVAGEMYVHAEGRRPVFDIPAAGLTAIHYRQDGILCLELQGQEAVLSFFGLDGRPGPVALEPRGGGWRVIAGP